MNDLEERRKKAARQAAVDDAFEDLPPAPLVLEASVDAVRFIRDAVTTQSARALEMACEAGLEKR